MIKSRFTLFALLTISLVYWPFFTGQTLGANDFPTINQTTLQAYLNWPQTWTNFGAGGLGYYAIAQIWLWPFLLLTGLLGYLGLDLMLIQRLIYFLPIIGLGFISCYWLGRKLQLSTSSSAVLTVFFLTNTYLLGLIDGGQLSIAVAYSLLPICYLLAITAWQKPLKFKSLAALSWVVLSMIEIRFLVLLALLTTARFLFELTTTRSKSLINHGFITALIIGLSLIATNFYWFLPIATYPPPSQLINSLTQTSFASFATLGHGLMFITPHWYQNSFGQISPLRPEFLVIPFLILLAPILRPRQREIYFYLLVWVGSVFLIKGANPPLSFVYPWLFDHLPSFNLFRDSTKFFALTAIAVGILIAFMNQNLTNYFKSRLLDRVIPTSLILLFILLASPAWLLQMSGIFSDQPQRQEFQQISQLLNNSPDYYRVMWIPSTPGLANSDIRHPIIEALMMTEFRPFAAGRLGSYELTNYLREAPYMGQLFDVLGVKYLAYPAPESPNSGDQATYYFQFFNQLRQLSWLNQPDPNLPVLKTASHQDRLFLTPNQWWVIGADDIYAEATTSADLNLNRNALIFVEEQPQLSQQLFSDPTHKITLHHKTITDLAALKIPTTELITPAQQLSSTPDQNTWWRPNNPISWKDFLFEKYTIKNQDFDLNLGLAVAEGTTSAQINNSKLQPNKLLLARVLESSQGGQLSFYQQNQLIGQLQTASRSANLRWQIIGPLHSNNPLTINTQGNLNAINALAVIDQNTWSNILNETQKLNLQPYLAQAISTNSAQLNYTRISPTHYQVEITNLTQPVTLVLSESYSPLWQLNNQSALPIYSLLNGFTVTQNGTYQLVFAPQHLIYPGLMISGSAGLLLIGLTIWLFRKP